MSMLTLFESRYTLTQRYNICNVGKTASMSMLTLFESRYTSNRRYNISNVGKTASMRMLTLFESRYTLKGRYNIDNVGQTASTSIGLSLCLLSLNQDMYIYINHLACEHFRLTHCVIHEKIVNTHSDFV